MFRPIPEGALLRSAPFRLIAPILFLLAVGMVILSLFSQEVFPSLFRRDVIILALFLALGGTVSIAATISFVHSVSTKRTLEEVKGLARNIL
jgi:positive regulator of sigma E activity